MLGVRKFNTFLQLWLMLTPLQGSNITLTTPPLTGSLLSKKPEVRGRGAQQLLQTQKSGYFTPDSLPIRGGEDMMSSVLDDQPRGRSPSGMAPVPDNIVLTKDGLIE